MQLALDYEPRPAPVPRLNPTAPAELAPKLYRACWAVLARLLQGAATADELAQAGGRRYAARIDELRRFLRVANGLPARDDANPILADKSVPANPSFRLASWARHAAAASYQAHQQLEREAEL